MVYIVFSRVCSYKNVESTTRGLREIFQRSGILLCSRCHTRPSGNDLQLPIHCLDEYMEIPLSGFVVFNQVGGNMGGPFV